MRTIFIYILCWFIIGCTDTTQTRYTNGRVASKSIHNSKGIQVERTVYFLDGSVKAREVWSDGGPGNGSVNLFYKNGVLKEVSHWKNGFLDGDFTQYYQSGRLKIKELFTRGRKAGASIIFDEKGQMSELALHDSLSRLYYFSKWNENRERNLQIFLPLIEAKVIADSIEISVEYAFEMKGNGRITFGKLDSETFVPIHEGNDLTNGKLRLVMPKMDLNEVYFRFDYKPAQFDSLGALGIQKKVIKSRDSIIMYVDYQKYVAPDIEKTTV